MKRKFNVREWRKSFEKYYGVAEFETEAGQEYKLVFEEIYGTINHKLYKPRDPIYFR